VISVELKMDINEWFEKNYQRLKIICQKITKEQDVDELFHFCIEQMLFNKNFPQIENDEEKVYFFTKIVRNNFYSNKSPYYTKYKKHKFLDIDHIQESNLGVHATENFEDIDMGWVRGQLEIIKEKEWYWGRLYELYIEEGCSLTKLSNRTTIPLNTVSRDIKKIRLQLRKLRNDKL
jgi:DNA-directed RNA polymerase specialized sigma24 family protein